MTVNNRSFPTIDNARADLQMVAASTAFDPSLRRAAKAAINALDLMRAQPTATAEQIMKYVEVQDY